MIILVYCEQNGKFNRFLNFYLQTLMNFNIHPILYILNNVGDLIELKTQSMCMSVISCNPNNWETINIFNYSSNSWKNHSKILKKHQHLNGKEITLGLFQNPPINRFKLINNDREVLVSGIASDIARLIAERYKFRI